MRKIEKEIFNATNKHFEDSVFLLENGSYIYCGGWNGENWLECFRCDANGYALDETEPYFEVCPEYDQDGDDFELVGLTF